MISVDYSLIITIINFLVLLYLLNKYVVKSLRKFLVARKEKIENDISEAEKLKLEAQNLIEENKTEVKKNRSEMKKEKELFIDKANEEAKDIIEDAKKKEQDIIDKVAQELQLERKKVMALLETDLSKIVIGVSEKVLKEKLDSSADEILVKKILADWS